MKLFRKKHKVNFTTTSGQKVCTVTFTQKEFNRILFACKLNNETIEEFFNNVIRDAARPKPTR